MPCTAWTYSILSPSLTLYFEVLPRFRYSSALLCFLMTQGNKMYHFVFVLLSITYKITPCIGGISLIAACVRHAEGVR
ncbi:MAG: hypothetical protein NZ455_16340 [Bacteroidia bacterium]|nr:hypothetical protein [Bacteroidia bacterium]MDW8348590.1 hypothetical protein [Bacteroidia bacterium]